MKTKEIIEILLIEANSLHAEFIANIFCGKKYNFRTINDGYEAYKYLVNSGNKPDIVLVDCRVPGMNSIQIIQKTLAAGIESGFIFISIDKTFDNAVRAMKAGALNFIHKSADLRTELPLMVDKVYGLHKAQIQEKEEQKRRYENEIHYRKLFHYSPVAYWEEDASRLKRFIDKLIMQGITDFRTYFDKNPDVVRKCTDLVKITSLNPTALKLYNLEHEDISKLRLSSFFEGKTYDNFKEEMLSFIEGKYIYTYNSVEETLKGFKKPIKKIVSTVLSNVTDWSKLIVVVVDVSEQKNADHDLKYRKEKYRSMFSQSPETIIVIGQEGTIVETNRAVSLVG